MQPLPWASLLPILAFHCVLGQIEGRARGAVELENDLKGLDEAHHAVGVRRLLARQLGASGLESGSPSRAAARRAEGREAEFRPGVAVTPVWFEPVSLTETSTVGSIRNLECKRPEALELVGEKVVT